MGTHRGPERKASLAQRGPNVVGGNEEAFVEDFDTEAAETEELKRRREFAQKLLEDRTLLQRPQRKIPEGQYSSLHIVWGALLLLLIVFVRRLPRYPGGKVTGPVSDADDLLSWESKKLLGDNLKEGLLKRLLADDQAAKNFLNFVQLSKESLERREQATCSFQKHMLQAMNPVLVVTDRIRGVLKQLPPLSETAPEDSDALLKELQALGEVEADASDKKAEFLSRWNTFHLNNEVYPETTRTALRRLFITEAMHMRKTSAMLEYQTYEAIKAKERGVTAPHSASREMQSLESQIQLAANAIEREVASCMEVLPPHDHWLLLLFVEHLPRASAESAQ